MEQVDQLPTPVLIGSYSDGLKKPSLFLYSPKDKTAAPVISTINPSYVLTTETYIFVASEDKKGELIALDLALNPIMVVETNGSDPCHISIDRQHKFIVVTNYTSGSFIVFLCGKDGLPNKGKFFVQHQGHSIHPERQQSPHCHSSIFSEDSKILFVADLGTDILYWYDISQEDIQMSKEKSIRFTGAGPRTIARGPSNEKTLLLTCQLDSTIRLMSYQDGSLNCIATYKTSNNPENYLSEVYYKDGLVYLTSRGDDYMLVFDYISQKSSLSEKFRFKVGAYPRHFLIDGKYIYIACQKEGKVYMFSRDGDKIMQLAILQIPDCSCIASYKQI